MTLLRRLNQKGLQGFADFLQSFKTDAPHGVPVDILTSAQTSDDIGIDITMEPQVFGSRLEAAKYLDKKLSDSGLRKVEDDTGLWAWLALFYFEQLCPPVARGQRKPGELARWIPEVTNYQRYYRHLLAGPYRIYWTHRDNPERALALLCGPIDRPGELVEQFASRQEMVTNKAIIQSATALYIDPATKKPRRGAGGKGPGSPRRLADVLKQFDVTWDLYTMSPQKLLTLLPNEFNRYREKASASGQPVA